MSIIAVVDYNMGNLRSVTQALQHVVPANTEVKITANADDVLKADRVVFPGQGAARDCMSELQKCGLTDVVLEAAKTKPFLGICMGMQVLMRHSEENGGVDCMGLYQGQVRHFAGVIGRTDASGERLKIPHMGWNNIQHTQDHPLWKGIDSGSRFYFVHSYFVEPDDPSLVAGTTEYGIRYASAIAKDNVFAIQSHPEKSADGGLQLLRNFTQWDGQS
ncbi:MAG: imidazole glycerol phosphate synthase subunit HisH [Proteobacteria bacterium]|nr:MAG: imidazole glycerol phosphate synthase subunit HisH [Pseudomonadota bacterium]